MIAEDVMALRTAIRNQLQADVALINRLGSSFVYDEAPPTAQKPFIAFSAVRSRDWSTSTDTGTEHFVTLDIWSTHHGVSECLDIDARVTDALVDAPLPMTGKKLVLLHQIALETVRRDRGRLAAARLTLRALVDAA